MANKKDIVKSLAKRTFLNQKESLKIIDELLKIVEEKTISDGEVKLSGFGKFFVYSHAKRPVRNPKTKEEMMLSPFKSIKFKSDTCGEYNFILISLELMFMVLPA